MGEIPVFVDWRSVHARFCAAMWVLVVVLAFVIVLHELPGPPAGLHHVAMRAVAR